MNEPRMYRMAHPRQKNELGKNKKETKKEQGINVK